MWIFLSTGLRIRSEASESQAKIIDLASEKGASSWLTSLPLAKYGFALNKQMFQDGICLRYNFALKLVARTCVCGELYTVNHCMTCKKGGYVILRHNSLRDLFAEILEEVCSDVQIEPPLLPLTGEKLPHGSNTTPGARLDVSARNLWSPLAKAFIDVRIFNPQAKTNWDRSIPQMYTSHENEKKTEYLPRYYRWRRQRSHQQSSLTSHVIKIFERVMRTFLVHWLEANNLLSKHQHGFRKSKSCVTQLLAHIDSILNICSWKVPMQMSFILTLQRPLIKPLTRSFSRNWKTLVSGERFLHG